MKDLHIGMMTKLVLILPADGSELQTLKSELNELRIECQGGYRPLHFKDIDGKKELNYTEDLWSRVLCIPIDVIYKLPKRKEM